MFGNNHISADMIFKNIDNTNIDMNDKEIIINKIDSKTHIEKNILNANKILNTDDLFGIENPIIDNKENFTEEEEEEPKEVRNTNDNNLFNFNQKEIQNSIGGLNFFEIFINDQNNNKELNSNMDNMDDAIMKNLFISQNTFNSAMFNSNPQNNLNEFSPDKQNILLKSLNYGCEIQKNVFHARKESGEIESDINTSDKLDFDKKENIINNNNNKVNNSYVNLKDKNQIYWSNASDINKDIFEKLNEQMKMRGINQDNFQLNMANMTNMYLNSNLANINNNNNDNINTYANTNVNNNLNASNQNKPILNNQLINNRINIPPNAVPSIIPAANMIPYPIINRDLMLNNMIQQGLIKPNMNINNQRIQNLTQNQLQYLETLRNSDRDKNSNSSNSNTNNNEFSKDKSSMHQNFLENPITVVEKNLVKKGWALMDDKNKPTKYLNSIELLSYLESEKKKTNINKLNFIWDIESDMYFKPSDFLEELQETIPKLIENLNAKNNQQKIQVQTPLFPDLRMMGIPIGNPATIQNVVDKENPNFKIPGIPLNINPMMIDQRIVNMNMIPAFPHMPNLRGNKIGVVNNINNNFNNQPVNMNINLQFVNNDIKLNNIMVGNTNNVNNNIPTSEIPNDQQTNNNNVKINSINNFINNGNQNINSKDPGIVNSNISNYNVNMQPGFNKSLLQNFQKSQNIPPGLPINPPFNLAMNNLYFSHMNQMMHNSNPNDTKANQNINQNINYANFNNNISNLHQKQNNFNNQSIGNYGNSENKNIYINFQDENATRKELNTFFGSNVFYEANKESINNNNMNNNNENNYKEQKSTNYNNCNNSTNNKINNSKKLNRNNSSQVIIDKNTNSTKNQNNTNNRK